MIPNPALRFSQRGSVNGVPFQGLRQLNEPDCVFASIGGAVNHLMGHPVWNTARDLYDAWVRARVGAVNFDDVIPVALSPIPNKIRYDLPRERIKNDPPQSFLAALANCVTSGGVAIVSVEAYETQQRTQGLGCWHMFTLIDRSQEWYQVWDTNGYTGSLNEPELETAFLGYDIRFQGKVCKDAWLHRHDKYDCLLVWRI
jgi:hypothetical protein